MGSVTEELRQELADALRALIEDKTPVTPTPVEGTTSMQNDLVKMQEESNQATYNALVELGGHKVTEESGITYIPQTYIGLPSLPQKMTKAQGGKLLLSAAANEEKIHMFRRVFKFRPWDGANALQNALKKFFGTTGEGKSTYSFFGENPPEKITITTGINEEVQVPWGAIDFPLFEGTLHTGVTTDANYGDLFLLTVEAPKKHGEAIDGLFAVVQRELEENSIYKGKAFVGVTEPLFMDPYKIQRHKVVYSDEAFIRLENKVWGVIRHADLLRAEGLSINSKVVLHGPFGTGKTLALGLTAQEAVQEGWTFIQCHTGKDDLEKVLKTAALYAPCVVGVEDIDVLAKAGAEDANSRLLELFDGLSVKNSEVMIVMTSNGAADLHKGMLRAGRVDATIEIGALDRAGVERLIKVNIPAGKLDENINWAAVHEAMDGYAPAFVKETFVSAQQASIIRMGSRDYRINTSDLVAAALMLRPQHELHDQAKSKSDEPTIEQLFGRIVVNELESRRVDRHNDGRIVKAEDPAA